MTREECEAKILQKLKEIREIVKEYDKSEELYLSVSIYDDHVQANNAHWETDTPLEVTEYIDGRILRL